MILPDWRIDGLLLAPEPVVYVQRERTEIYGPIDDSQVQPASLDVRLADDFRDYVTGDRIIGRHGSGSFFLGPGEQVLGSLVESFAIPTNLVGMVKGKSSWARKFLTTHAAGLIDPGFRGDITLELKNDGRMSLELTPGQVIAQVVFYQMVAPAGRSYGDPALRSHYQGQSGTTPSAL